MPDNGTAKTIDALALAHSGRSIGSYLRRKSSAGVTLLLPFVILICDLRWELAATAACFCALLFPGLLLVQLLFSTGHPLRAFPAGFGTATTMSLLLFGLPSLFALKLHWRISTFLLVFVMVYVAACAALVTRRRKPQGVTEADTSPFHFPLVTNRGTGLILLLAATLTGAGGALGTRTEAHDWWPWTSVGAAGGVLALAAVGVARLRARGRRGAADDRKRTEPTALAREAGRPHPVEQWLAVPLWLGIAALTVYMMRSAYTRPGYGPDNVTYVSQAVDYLSGAPLNCYEPSLGFEIPMDPGFLLGTIPLLAASISYVTGIPPAALLHTLLLPLFVLAGVCSFAGVLAVLLRQHRLLTALALAVLLIVLLKTSDTHRSTVHLLIYCAATPKSVHLLAILPIQLALLLLTVTRPDRRHTSAAILAAIAGHLVHPWSSAVGVIWSGVLLAYALLAKRSALWSILLVAGTFGACGSLHQLDAKYNFFGVGESPAVTPIMPIELVRTEAGVVRTRLDAAQTIGQYSLDRLGVLSVPWVLLLGWRNRACLLVGVLSLAALALSYYEPLAALLSKAMVISLLWRMRWMVPCAVNVALLGVCVYWAATVLLRRCPDRPAGPVASFAGVVVTLAATIGMMAATPSRLVGPFGPVGDLTKCHAASHAIAAGLGGWDARSFVLTPEPLRSPLSWELCQLVPNVRLIMSRDHEIRWYFGEKELQARLNLIRRFYSGLMSREEFQEMLRQFPLDCVIVDYSEGRGSRQARLLSSLAWMPGKRFHRYEMWWAPRKVTDER
ncbi:MAG: DUF6077 domain-containing protein [Planctomycetota bacterium]